MPKKSEVQPGSIASMPARHSARMDAMAEHIPPITEEDHQRFEEEINSGSFTETAKNAGHSAAVQPEDVSNVADLIQSGAIVEETPEALGQAAFDGDRDPAGQPTAESAADAEQIRATAELMDAYGVPASATVLRVVADAVAGGKRVRRVEA